MQTTTAERPVVSFRPASLPRRFVVSGRVKVRVLCLPMYLSVFYLGVVKAEGVPFPPVAAFSFLLIFPPFVYAPFKPPIAPVLLKLTDTVIAMGIGFFIWGWWGLPLGLVLMADRDDELFFLPLKLVSRIGFAMIAVLISPMVYSYDRSRGASAALGLHQVLFIAVERGAALGSYLVHLLREDALLPTLNELGIRGFLRKAAELHS